MNDESKNSARPRGRDRRDIDRPHAKFGSTLRRTREFAGLTRTELAERSNIPYPVLANLETGRRRASDNMIEKIASGLSVDKGQIKKLRNLAESPDGDIRIRNTFQNVAQYLNDSADGTTTVPPDLSLNGMPVQLKSDNRESPSWDMFQLWQFLAGPSLSAWQDSSAERKTPVKPPRRIHLLQSISSETESMDEEDLLRVAAFLDGMRAARNPPDVHE